MMRHSRTLPAAVAALFLITACGSDDPSTVGQPVDAPDDGLLVPTPIRAVGGNAAGASQGAEAATADAATDMMLPYASIEYVLGDVGELPTNTTGYVLPAGATVDAARVAAVAAVLGVAGEPVPGSAEMGTSWQVGPTDGSAPSLTVGSDAQLGWWYNAAWADGDGRTIEPCVVSVDTDGNQTETCPEPAPPAGIPTGEQAEQRARDLLAAMGEDPASFEYQVYADEWFASVNAGKPLGGVASPLVWGFGFGEDGALQYANGSFAAPQAVGPYPLIDLDTAFARLQDQGSYWGGGVALADVGVARVEMAVADSAVADSAVAEPAVAEPAVAGSAVAEPTTGGDAAVSSPAEPTPAPVEGPTEEPVEEPVDAPMPPVDGTIPTPEPLVVTLVDVEADVWWTWDEDGSIWLLPAYRFVGDDGGWYTVPAVTDEYLVLVEPQPVPEPMPAEPMPEPMPVETAQEASTPTPDAPSVTTADFVRTDFDDLVGLPLDQFTDEAKGRGAETRVVLQDGQGLDVTADFSPARVNVEVTTIDGVQTVTSVTGIG